MSDLDKFLYMAILAQLAIPIMVLLLNAKRKSAERRAGNVDPESVINNTAWALPVVLTSNSLANQFQLPIIFYVLSLTLLQLGQVDWVVLGLAWWFVTLRWIHAYVHVTSNYIPMRFGSFLASSLGLLALFVYTAWTILLL